MFLDPEGGLEKGVVGIPDAPKASMLATPPLMQHPSKPNPPCEPETLNP